LWIAKKYDLWQRPFINNMALTLMKLIALLLNQSQFL